MHSRRVVLTGAVTAAALISIWHEARPTWHALNAGYAGYAQYSIPQREESPLVGAGFPPAVGDVFTFAASELRRGDRMYFQVPRTRYGTLDLHDTVAALGRYYFLPAVEVHALERATVVFSYDADPRRLHVTFLNQTRWGGDALSRLSYP